MVDYYLKRLKVNPDDAADATAAAAKAAATPPKTAAGRTTTATQARIAEANKNLPRTSAVTGAPAPARSDRPSMASLRKKLAGVGR
jgi:hypothetical protein